MTVLIELDDEQADALNALSARSNKPVRVIVGDALAAILAAESEGRSLGIDQRLADDVAFSRREGASEPPPTWHDMDGLEYQRLVRSQ